LPRGAAPSASASAAAARDAAAVQVRALLLLRLVQLLPVLGMLLRRVLGLVLLLQLYVTVIVMQKMQHC
jgi:hypothetical protein